MARKSVLYISGVTAEGEPLIGGVAKFYYGEGFPIDVSYEILKDKGSRVDWAEALADGWLNDPAVHEKILYSIKMLLGDETAEKIKQDFTKWVAALAPDTKTGCQKILEIKKSKRGP